MKKAIVLILGFIGLFSSTCLAETIYLKSGDKIEGKIIERTNEYIRVDAYGVPVTYYLEDIKDIEGESVKSVASKFNPETAKSSQQIFEEVSPAVVVITTQDAMGSGFVVDSKGVIMTNFHVVAGAKSITVKFKDGKEYPASGIISYDPRMDICILKIDASGLQSLSLGDADKLKQGERVLVIGAPLGLEYSISDGLFSSRRSELYEEVLQFTAPISPGNSGGPLLDMQGRAIGVVTFVRFGGQNLNFAVSINQAKELIAVLPKINIRDFAEVINKDYSSLLATQKAMANGEYKDAIKYCKDSIEVCRDLDNKECLLRIIDFCSLNTLLGGNYFFEKNYSEMGNISRECMNKIESLGGPKYLLDKIQKNIYISQDRLSDIGEHNIGGCYFDLGVATLYANDKDGAYKYADQLEEFAPKSARELKSIINEWDASKKGNPMPENEATLPTVEENDAVSKLDSKTTDFIRRGLDACLKGEYDLGIQYFKNALSRIRKNSAAYSYVLKGIAPAYKNICKNYIQKGFLDEAVKYCKEGIALIGDYKDTYIVYHKALLYFELGFIYYKKGDRDGILRCVKELRQIKIPEANEWANDLEKEARGINN